MQQKRLPLSWVLCGALLCMLLVDLFLLNYNQQRCSLCVQLDRQSAGAAGFQFSVDQHGHTQEVADGLKRLQTHSNAKRSQRNGKQLSNISQYPDIDVRGKWQRKQVDKFCKKYGEDELLYVLPNTSSSETKLRYKLLRHLLYDDKRKAILCFIPKVGCTNLRRFFFLTQGVISEQALQYNMSDSWEHQRLEGRFLQPGIEKGSLQNEDLNDRERLERIKSYFKVTFVRHPLERLLSAYLDKISPPVRFTKVLSNSDLYQRYILLKTKKEDYDKWMDSGGSYNLFISFSEYIQWWVGSDGKYVDEHYSSLLVNAQPCRLRYDFYGSFKLYSSDMSLVIKRLNGSTNHFSNEGTHPVGKETREKMATYYSQLSAELRTALYERMYKELDFYYHLYPEESDSHKQILGFL